MICYWKLQVLSSVYLNLFNFFICRSKLKKEAKNEINANKCQIGGKCVFKTFCMLKIKKSGIELI